MRRRVSSTAALTFSSILLSAAMQPSLKAAAFVATLPRSALTLSCIRPQATSFSPPPLSLYGSKGANMHISNTRTAAFATKLGSVLVPPPARQFTIMSMTMKDWDNNEGNKTDVYSSVGAAGNLRSPGKGFKPPSSPRVDRANFAVKPEDKETGKVPFQERQKKANFDDLVEFPCKFQIKIVGANQGEFMEDILDSIGNVVKVERASLPHSFRDKGKWRSITVRVPVESAEQLYEVYAAIDKDPRVQFKF